MTKINALSHILEHAKTLDNYYSFKTYDDVSSIVAKLGGMCHIIGENIDESQVTCLYVSRYYITGATREAFFNFYPSEKIRNKSKGLIVDRFSRNVEIIFIEDSNELNKILDNVIFTVDNFLYEQTKKRFISQPSVINDMENAIVRLQDISKLINDPYIVFDIAKKKQSLDWEDYSQKHPWPKYEAVIDDAILSTIRERLPTWKFDLPKVKKILSEQLTTHLYVNESYIKVLNSLGISKHIFGCDIVPIGTKTSAICAYFHTMWKDNNPKLIEMGLSDEDIRNFKLHDEIVLAPDTRTFPEHLKTKSEVYEFSRIFRRSGDREKDNSYYWHLASVPLIPEQIKVKVSEFEKLGIPRKRVPEVKKEICKLFFNGELTNNGYCILRAAEKIWQRIA